MNRALDSNLAVVLNGRAKSVNDAVVDLMGRLVPEQDLYVSRSMSDARRIVRTIVDRRYRTVLTGGGDGTFAGAHAIAAECERQGLKISIIGIPKTIDNDIYFT